MPDPESLPERITFELRSGNRAHVHFALINGDVASTLVWDYKPYQKEAQAVQYFIELIRKRFLPAEAPASY